MALNATSPEHQMQIIAGTEGRKKGHKFEKTLTEHINELDNKLFYPVEGNTLHVFCGSPAEILLQYIANDRNVNVYDVKAWWLGGLATSGVGDALQDEEGNPITKCKSDVLLQITSSKGLETIGVSVKNCNKKTPTNDQMYFTTAKAFCYLLRTNGISVSSMGEQGMSMFCGDIGFRPLDIMTAQQLNCRNSDPNRFYWEELPCEAQQEWKEIFTVWQDYITMLLFQKAYKDDPYPPDYLLHQTVRYSDFEQCDIAVFSMEEIVAISKAYSGFELSPYVIRKGTYKNDNKIHYAPRFGFIQFQRGGQRQHPTQLQFNLKAGYFRKI